MYQQDYLTRLIALFIKALTRSLSKGGDDPRSIADGLEEAVGKAVEMDPSLFLSLAPESMISMMQISAVDPRMTEYICRSLALESVYLRKAGETALADVRLTQARAIASSYGHVLPDDLEDVSDLVSAGEEQAGEL